MGAFVVAGIVAVITILITLFMLFAAGMSDAGYAARDAEHQAIGVFLTGMIIAALIAATHWLPHIGW